MIDKFCADGTLLRLAPVNDGIGPRARLVFDDEHAEGGTLEPIEAAELGLALLRFAADAVADDRSLRVALSASLDRTSRLLGTALVEPS